MLAIVGLVASGLIAAAVAVSSGQPAPEAWPAYHLMPAPAYRSHIAVLFASAGRPGGQRRQSPWLPGAPFRQCPAIGADRGCGLLVDITGRGRAVVVADHQQGPFDGSAATLVGVLNTSGRPVGGLAISANAAVFAFRGGGICAGGDRPLAGCPFGPTGYEGPGVGFSGIGPHRQRGVVTFSPPLGRGGTAYFGLAQGLAATVVAGGTPQRSEQGGPPNAAERQVPCSPGPVNCATGELWERYTDFSVPGIGVPLDFTRTYSTGQLGSADPFGHGWSFSYGMSVRPGTGGTEIVRQEDGAEVTFQPGPAGGYQAPAWVMATLTAGPSGGYTFERFADHVRYVFSAAGRLLAEIDQNGNATRLTYYPDGRLRWVTDATGRRLTFTFAGSFVHSVTDPLGRAEVFGYRGGDLVSVTAPADRRWRFGYDRAHRLTSIVLASKGVPARRISTTVRYYRSGAVHTVSSASAGTTAWRYAGTAGAPAGGVTIVRSPGNGLVKYVLTRYYYSGLELMAVTHAAGSRGEASTGYTYTPAALVRSVTDPDLRLTTFAYDRHGDLADMVNPLRARTAYRYDSLGGVIETKLAGLPASTAGYDRHGNLLWTRDPLGELTTYARRPGHPSEVATITGPAGQVRYRYDQWGDVAAMSVSPRPGQTDTTAYAYNADGELTCEVAPDAYAALAACPSSGSPHQPDTTSYTYDGNGQLTAITGPAGQSTVFGYDLNGDISKITQPDLPRPTVISYTYNALHEQTSVARNGELVATATYAASGDQLTQTTGGNQTRYGYDLLGHVVWVTDPLHRKTVYRYDHAGHEVMTINPAGQVTRYGYDAVGELVAVSYGRAGPPVLLYSFYPDGQPQTVTDSTGTTSYSYDYDQRLTAASHTGAAGAYSYRYQYLDRLREITEIYPNGRKVISGYDGAGQLVSVRDWLGNTIRFGYESDGNLVTERYPGRVAVAYSSTGIAITGPGNTPAHIGIASDPADRLTSTTTTGLPGVTGKPAGYTYTPLGQLSAAGHWVYGYDKAGNLSRLPGITQVFNRDGQLSRSLTGGVVTSYSYDKVGGLTGLRRGRHRIARLRYNQAGQLVSYRAAGTNIGYAYDGNGLRTAMTLNGTRTSYVWDQRPAVPVLLSAVVGTSRTAYIYGPAGQPVEQITGSTPTFMLADQLGSIRELTSVTGRRTGTYSYSPYGTVTAHTGASTALRYNGQLTDPVTGYIYLRARYYNPATGQFLTRDPATALTGTPYAYAADDPANATDPTGLSWWNPISWVAAGVHDAALLGHAAGYLWHITIGEHWRGLLKGAVAIGAAALAAACIAATDGLCGIVIEIASTDVELGTILGTSAIGLAEHELDYLISPGHKSVGGAFEAAGIGVLTGGGLRTAGAAGSALRNTLRSSA